MMILLLLVIGSTMAQGLTLAQAGSTMAQAAPPQESAAAPGSEEAPAGDLPVSLDRVQRALARPPAISLEGKQVYRVEVVGKKLTIEDLLGPDYLKGPVPRAGMTHQEFLAMVTPKDFQGYAPYTNREGMAMAATSFALKWAVQRAVHKYQTAAEGRDREAARREVEQALLDLDKAREKAGLPPR